MASMTACGFGVVAERVYFVVFVCGAVVALWWLLRSLIHLLFRSGDDTEASARVFRDGLPELLLARQRLT